MNYTTFFWDAGLLESFPTKYPPITMLAYVPGDEERAAMLARQLLDRVPWNWELVLVRDQHTNLNLEWFVRWSGARVLIWQENVHGAHYAQSNRPLLSHLRQ